VRFARRSTDHHHREGTMVKAQLNIRLSDQARAYLDALQDRYGLSQGGIVELLIRDRVVHLKQTEGWEPKRTLGAKR